MARTIECKSPVDSCLPPAGRRQLLTRYPQDTEVASLVARSHHPKIQTFSKSIPQSASLTAPFTQGSQRAADRRPYNLSCRSQINFLTRYPQHSDVASLVARYRNQTILQIVTFRAAGRRPYSQAEKSPDSFLHCRGSFYSVGSGTVSVGAGSVSSVTWYTPV